MKTGTINKQIASERKKKGKLAKNETKERTKESGNLQQSTSAGKVISIT